MPLPLLPIALRLTAVAAAGWAVRRALTPSHPGRTDQRAEDALDDLDEGFSLHKPADRATEGTQQTNLAARMRRVIRWGEGGVELDMALLGRVKLRKL